MTSNTFIPSNTLCTFLPTTFSIDVGINNGYSQSVDDEYKSAISTLFLRRIAYDKYSLLVIFFFPIIIDNTIKGRSRIVTMTCDIIGSVIIANFQKMYCEHLLIRISLLSV